MYYYTKFHSKKTKLWINLFILQSTLVQFSAQKSKRRKKILKTAPQKAPNKNPQSQADMGENEENSAYFHFFFTKIVKVCTSTRSIYESVVKGVAHLSKMLPLKNITPKAFYQTCHQII